MASCVEVMARTLREAGITTMFGLPGGEILEFMEAARREGIDFVLTRDEGTAAFMADVTGQIRRVPGVCVATLGPGAVNMTLGVANAYLDRSPVLAVTASLSLASEPYATHQNIDLNAVYRPFTKMSITLDGTDTEKKVCEAIAVSMAPRMGPVHIAIPSDVAKRPDRVTDSPSLESVASSVSSLFPASDLESIAKAIRTAKRPVIIIGLDVNPYTDTAQIREFVEKLGAPTFVTPKAKGIFPADHRLFYGVCAGIAGDAVVVDLFSRSDLLIGIGFDPVESDKLWHHTMKLVSIGPVSIAAGEYRPYLEAVGNLNQMLETLGADNFGPSEWSKEDELDYRSLLDRTLRPTHELNGGFSPSEVTRAVRAASPRETLLVTDVGSIKSVSSQCWDSFSPLTFFESNGLSAMGYGFSGAMAAKLLFPELPVVCIMGDGGFGMKVTEIETCIRCRINFVTIVYNDNCLSLIRVSQQTKGYQSFGVDYGPLNFTAVAEALGAWAHRASSLDDLKLAVESGLKMNRPVVIEVPIDPREYHAHNSSTLITDQVTA
jgi:acetolactate synthase-1/2/3 large subunit